MLQQVLIGALVLAVAGVSGFQGPRLCQSFHDRTKPNSIRKTARSSIIPLLQSSANSNNSNSDDSLFESSSLRPETSFGSAAVPEAQRPINEYLDVTSQPLFGWANRASGDIGLLTRLSIFYVVVFSAVCWPISGATYTQEGYLWQKLSAANVGASMFLLVLMIRLYTGWGYIGSRLKSKVIEYEETGWYDGDWERKTEAELLRDRLLYNSDVKPVLDRLKRFTAGTALVSVLSLASLHLAVSSSEPMFNQYDPQLLEKVRYDDTLADTAAQNTGGKPAYCNSRYYTAVANGGQGC